MKRLGRAHGRHLLCMYIGISEAAVVAGAFREYQDDIHLFPEAFHADTITGPERSVYTYVLYVLQNRR